MLINDLIDYIVDYLLYYLSLAEHYFRLIIYTILNRICDYAAILICATSINFLSFGLTYFVFFRKKTNRFKNKATFIALSASWIGCVIPLMIIYPSYIEHLSQNCYLFFTAILINVVIAAISILLTDRLIVSRINAVEQDNVHTEERQV